MAGLPLLVCVAAVHEGLWLADADVPSAVTANSSLGAGSVLWVQCADSRQATTVMRLARNSGVDPGTGAAVTQVLPLAYLGAHARCRANSVGHSLQFAQGQSPEMQGARLERSATCVEWACTGLTAPAHGTLGNCAVTGECA